MKKGDFKKRVSDHFETRSLSKHQLESLMKLDESGTREQVNKYSYTYRIISYIFFILLTVAGTVYFATNPVSLEDKIGTEVAKNHIKLKPLEIKTSKIQAIRDYFTQLEFVPVESNIVQLQGKELLGGRYCSIQGVTAAQLRLKDKKTGHIQSLYQADYKPEIFSGLPKLEEGKQPVTLYSKGLEIDVWVEKGIVFALTRDSEKK